MCKILKHIDDVLLQHAHIHSRYLCDVLELQWDTETVINGDNSCRHRQEIGQQGMVAVYNDVGQRHWVTSNRTALNANV